MLELGLVLVLVLKIACASIRVRASARICASVKDSANVCLRQMYSKWKS